MPSFAGLTSPAGTAEEMRTFSRPSGTFVVGRVRKPGVETPGYYQMSLRDISRPGDGAREMGVIARLQARGLLWKQIEMPNVHAVPTTTHHGQAM